jgi:hypothetical protein
MELFNPCIISSTLLQIAWFHAAGCIVFVFENSERKITCQVASWTMSSKMAGKKAQ